MRSRERGDSPWLRSSRSDYYDKNPDARCSLILFHETMIGIFVNFPMETAEE